MENVDNSKESLLQTYLEWLVSQHKSLTLFGSFANGITLFVVNKLVVGSSVVIQVPLEKVYVALRCLACSPYEKESSRTLFEKELAELYSSEWDSLSVEGIASLS